MNFNNEIDYSSLSDYILCPRKFFFRHILCFVRSGIPSIDLVFGSCWHHALAQGYEALKAEPSISPRLITEISFKAFSDLWKIEGEPWFDPDASFPKSPGRAKDMLTEYWSQFLDVDSLGRVIATEAPFTISIEEDLPLYIGRLDAVLEFEGWLYIYEHKTARSVNPAVLSGFQNSLQCEGYLTAGNLYYDKIPRVLYNIALCQKSKIDFTRHEVTKSESAIDRFITEMILYIERILDEIDFYQEFLNFSHSYERNASFPMFLRANATLACTQYFRTCPYFDLCMARNNPASYRDFTPSGFEISEWNPREHEENIKLKLTQLED